MCDIGHQSSNESQLNLDRFTSCTMDDVIQVRTTLLCTAFKVLKKRMLLRAIRRSFMYLAVNT